MPNKEEKKKATKTCFFRKRLPPIWTHREKERKKYISKLMKLFLDEGPFRNWYYERQRQKKRERNNHSIERKEKIKWKQINFIITLHRSIFPWNNIPMCTYKHLIAHVYELHYCISLNLIYKFHKFCFIHKII